MRKIGVLILMTQLLPKPVNKPHREDPLGRSKNVSIFSAAILIMGIGIADGLGF
jgi:hypothetical protein